MQHTELALSYIRVTWRMIKLYHLASLKRQCEKGNMPDIRADVVAVAYEAAYESPEFDFETIREKFRPLVRRWFNARRIFSPLPDFRGSRDCRKRLEPILAYYELDTFEGTCQKFGLKPTHALRKLFSAACPKPELGQHKGVIHNNAERIETQPGWTTRYIMDTYGVSKSTACRARQRGYFYKPAGRVGRVENLFSAKEIMNALLNSQYQQEIIASLQVSETYSFYFRIDGQLYRVSNHAPKHWSLRLSQEECIDISPAGNPAYKDKLLNSISSPQKQQAC